MNVTQKLITARKVLCRALQDALTEARESEESRYRNGSSEIKSAIERIDAALSDRAIEIGDQDALDYHYGR